MAVAAHAVRVIIGVESGNEVARLASTSKSAGSGVGWSRSGVGWSRDGRHVVIGQWCGLVSVYEADGWREVWHRQIDGVGYSGVGVRMTRCGKWIVAAALANYMNRGERARLMSVGGDIDTAIGPEGVCGIGVGGGGKRVVTSHRNPNRCEVSGGVGKVVNVVGSAGRLAIVDGGSGMLIVSGRDVVYVR